MKACFFLQRNFAKLAYAMCVEFDKNHGINEFCGFVHGKKAEDFLAQQKNIFSNLIYDSKIYEAAKNEKLDLVIIILD